MVWAKVSSWSCVCWLYRASPSLAAKNIINLILVLTIWWRPCIESSLVLLEEGVCYDKCIFLAKLYQSLPCFTPYSKAKFACYSRCFLTSYFCIPIPYEEKGIYIYFLFSVSSRRSCRFSQNQSTSASSELLVWGIGLDYCNIEWFALEMNQDHSAFLKLYPSTAFQTLLLTMMVTPFLLRDSCPQ